LKCKALLATHSELGESDLVAAREYNQLRYHYQGIGRYEPAQVYRRGVADLEVVSNVLGSRAFVFGEESRSIDAAVYGFVANIHYYDIDTPLRQFVHSRPNLVRHCEAMHAMVAGHDGPAAP